MIDKIAIFIGFDLMFILLLIFNIVEYSVYEPSIKIDNRIKKIKRRGSVALFGLFVSTLLIVLQSQSNTIASIVKIAFEYWIAFPVVFILMWIALYILDKGEFYDHGSIEEFLLQKFDEDLFMLLKDSDRVAESDVHKYTKRKSMLSAELMSLLNNMRSVSQIVKFSENQDLFIDLQKINKALLRDSSFVKTRLQTLVKENKIQEEIVEGVHFYSKKRSWFW